MLKIKKKYHFSFCLTSNFFLRMIFSIVVKVLRLFPMYYLFLVLLYVCNSHEVGIRRAFPASHFTYGWGGVGLIEFSVHPYWNRPLVSSTPQALYLLGAKINLHH